MGSKLLKAASEVDIPENGKGASQPTKTIRNISDAEKVAQAIERQYPNAELHEAPIQGQGKTASGVRVVTLAVKQTEPSGTAILYHNGTLSLSGVMVDLRL